MQSSKIQLIGAHPTGFPRQSSRPRQRRARPGSYPAKNPGDNSCAEPLEASRRPFSEHTAHNDPQVVTRHRHQVTLADLQQPTQPAPTSSSRLANMRERPLHLLTAELLQPLAPMAAHPPSVVPIRLLPLRRLVRPDTIVLTLLLRDVGPHRRCLTVCQGLGLVVTLI